MSSKIILDFGSIEFYPNFAIGEINEGIDISFDQFLEFSDILITHFNGRPFGYISNRINSYCVDPTNFSLSSKIDNLFAIAVVLSRPAQKYSSRIEELFYGKSFQYFTNLELAKQWMQKTINLEASVQR